MPEGTKEGGLLLVICYCGGILVLFLAGDPREEVYNFLLEHPFSIVGLYNVTYEMKIETMFSD